MHGDGTCTVYYLLPITSPCNKLPCACFLTDYQGISKSNALTDLRKTSEEKLQCIFCKKQPDAAQWLNSSPGYGNTLYI